MDIAVIGMAYRFPGARDPRAFWRNLAERQTSISEVPPDRWDWRAYWGDPKTEGNKTLSKWGGFIDQVDAFDAGFFGLLPKVIHSMDPQQRLMLELAWACLEDAGIAPTRLRGRKVGVVFGVFTSDYKELRERSELPMEAHHATGTAYNVVANRVSHFLDLRGPSIPLDTACSSSLNAIHSAIQAIEYGDCEMALAGGINLLLTPTRHLSASKMGMLSPTGSCKTLDASADGYVRGEGAGIVLLKPLDRALADGDAIYGVIKGSAVNHCGETYTLTYPSAQAQADVIVAAHTRARVPISSISYVELHGTGTPKGDPIEFQGLCQAFAALAEQQGVKLSDAFCGLSSLKTNIGHLEGAAGIASVIKVLLAFQHRTLPGMHGYSKLNPRITIEGTPFYVLDETREWRQQDERVPRRAGISSFGFSGSNAHLVLEEAPRPKAVRSRAKPPAAYLVALSAKTPSALLRAQGNLLAWLREDGGATPLADVAATLLGGRSHLACRWARATSDAAELIDALEHAVAAGEVPAPTAPSAPGPELVARGQALLSGLTGKKPVAAGELREKLRELASLFVAGADLAWAELYAGRGGRRVRLPTYPFARDLHWRPEFAPALGTGAGRLHPLLHRNASTLGMQRFTSTFTGSELFLADHHVGGRPQLPAVVYLEMVRAAVVEACGAGATGAVRISDVRWPRPLEHTGTPLEVQVELAADGPGPGAVQFRVTAGSGPDAAVHCHGRARFVEAKAPSMDVAALERACDGPVLGAEACYRSLEALGFKYGPAHRALERLHRGAGQCLADVSAPAAQRDAYVLHPGVVDAALQAAVALATGAGESSGAVLPSSVEQVVVHGPCNAPVRAWVRYTSGGDTMLDIDLFPAGVAGQAHACLEIRGLRLQADVAAPSASPRATVPDALTGALYVPVWTAQPLEQGTRSLSGELLLAGRPEDVEWLAAKLQASEHFASVRLSRLCWGELRPASLEDHEKAVARLPSPPTHVLFVAPRVGAKADDGAAAPGLTDDVLGVFSLTRALMRSSKALRLVHLVPAANPEPEHLGLSGYYKTLRIERPSYAGRVVACAADEVPAGDLARLLRDELCATDHETDVRWSGGVRSVRRFASAESGPIPASGAPLAAAPRHNGVYLITGGMGALGLLVARHLCSAYQATVYLTGRRAPGAEQARALAALGGKAIYLPCDVAKREDVRRAIAEVRVAGHRLNGVIHAAGVLEDAFILRKAPDAFARVIAPKVAGTRNLDQETRDEPLDFFAVFSSLAGVLGNVGQCDYAYGNACEDALAHRRAAMVEAGVRRGKTVSIDWPYWRDGGMRLTEEDEAALRRSFGVVPLETADGLAAFEHGLRQPHAQLVLMQGERERIAEVLGAIKPASAQVALPRDGSAELTVDQLRASVASHLAKVFAEQLGIPANFELDRQLREYGFDSVVMVNMIDELEKSFGRLSKTLFFEYSTLGEVSAFLVESCADVCRKIAGATSQATAVAAPQPAAIVPAATVPAEPAEPALPVTASAKVRPSGDAIAIIGIAGRYPKADSLEEFWENLKKGLDCVEEVPLERWDVEAMARPGAARPARWGGFLRRVDQFDPLFFNISPKEAELMDPHERLFLETVAHAIEDAGYTPDKLAPRDGVKENPVGVFVGTMWGDYQLYGVDGPPNRWVTPHSCYWAVANRVSYFFNFSGPSMTVDTACSSSLTAIHLACAAIRSGEIGAAIAGGVSLSLHPNKYNVLSDMHFLASNGRCVSFGIGGDGYVPGEGVGAVLLKSLDRAIADGDHIYGIIRGTSVNHGGKTSGFTVPNPLRQAALVQEALQSAGVDPRTISYVEAHGTGTSLGDPIEISGLTKAYAQKDVQYCAIGSVKSNIGHLEAAAGIAALTKVLLQMKHRTLVPSIHSSTLNPHIEFDKSPFVVQRSLAEWRRPRLARTPGGPVEELPRLAGISSFGAGGSNAHMIVQEWPDIVDERAAMGAPQRPVLLVLSARKEASLRALAGQLASRLAADPRLSLEDVAYTLQVGRVPLELRFALVVASAAEAVAALRAYAQGGPVPPGAFAGRRDEPRRALGSPAAAAPEVSELPGWLAQRDLARIAQVWVRGARVEWERLHPEGSRRRVSLPGYVFERQRYWIDRPLFTTQGMQARADLASQHGLAALHPLLDANVSTLEEQTFRKTLHPEEFFLRDHRLGSNGVLPAVAYLEMALQACRLAAPHRPVVALRDVSWLRPLVVGEGGETVYIGLQPEAEGVSFEIYRLEEDGRRAVFANGHAELASKGTAPVRRAARIDVQAVVGRCLAHSGEEVAGAFGRAGLKLGPSFRVIDALYSNSNEAYARLAAPEAAETAAGTWMLHPALVDSAVRTAQGIGGLEADAGLWVPVHLRRLEVLRPVTNSCGALAVPGAGTPRADLRHFDITIVGTDGDVLARIEGFAVQRAPQLALALAPQAKAAAAGPALPSVTAPGARSPAVAAERPRPQPVPEPAAQVAPPADAVSPAAVRAGVLRHLTELLSAVTKVAADQIDPHAALENYGIDSVMILRLNQKLQESFGDIPKTLFFEYQDLDSLTTYFLESRPEQSRALAQVMQGLAAPEPAPSIEPELAARMEVLLACLHEVLGAAAAGCTAETPLPEWPIDPVASYHLAQRLGREFADVTPEAVYRHETLTDWARELRRLPSRAPAAAPDATRAGKRRFEGTRSSSEVGQDIAIIGLSGRYPGAANVEQFWANLCAGKDSIVEIPGTRWDYRPYFNPDKNVRGESYAKWGSFIEDIDKFDAAFFRVAPREAEVLDPQERLFLQTAWECFEDACYPRPALKGHAVGVFVGVMWGHYEMIDVSEEQRQYGWPSASFASIANRVSYFMNLNGPSVALDTMCSSSLTAIHLACLAMRNGDCDMAIAGGVNLNVHRHKYRMLSAAKFLATDGRCRAFGAGGDGYVPGEGMGAVLLKPYEKALADGDQIHGVIRATALNHGGKTNGYTVPNQTAQRNVIATALRRAGWHPRTVEYVEAHGTGTALGDPIEIAGLTKAFADVAADYGQDGGAVPAGSCRIGSLKTNIGHLESAAGIAGLTKVLLQMRHGRIPASLHSSTLNPNIDFGRTPFQVVQQLEDWSGVDRATPRRAGVSSFGAGGANAHLLVEEHLERPEQARATGPVIFVLSADREERLALYVERVLAFLKERAAAGRPVELRSLAYSSQVGREPMEERLAVVASSVEELTDALAQLRQGTIAAGVHRGSARRHGDKLDAIMEASEQEAFVRQLVQGGRLQQLAKAWVSFLDVDWAAMATELYGDPRPRRASFPTMPFLGQRYWVQEKVESSAGPARALALHPFLDENVSTLARQAYAKTFSGDEFYLRDHVVEAGGKRLILPGAAYLEMARAAGQLGAGPEWVVRRIRDLFWLRVLEVRGAPESVQVSLGQDGDRVTFQVTRGDGELCVEGELELAPRGEVPADEVVDLAALRAGGSEEGHQQIYEAFRGFGFHFGPSFRVTQQRWVMPDAALSRVVLPEHLVAEAGKFELHPSLLDGILRTCMPADREAMSAAAGPVVPFALGELELLHPLPREVWAYARRTKADADDASGLRKCDVTVTDAAGRVLLRMKDVAGRVLAKAADAQPGAPRYYRADWVEAPLGKSAGTLAGATALVVSADERLGRRLAEGGTFGRVVTARAVSGGGDAEGLAVNPTDEASWQRLLARLDAEGARATHVVLHADEATDAPAAELAPADAGVRSIRALFRALERQQAGQAVRCAYVFGAGRDEHRPHRDAVSALARSFLTINHRFELFTLRHDRQEPSALAASLVSELGAPGNSSGQESAWWDGARYQRVLAEVTLDAGGQEAPLRERGAYLITGGAGKLGLVLATHLARRHRARLVLSGRSPELSTAQREAIEAMRGAGAEVHYVRADISVSADVEALVAEARRRFGRLDGVIHCAGVAGDKPVTELDEAEFSRLYMTKAEGARLLDEATRDEKLDFFVHYSSVSAVLGDPGTGAYAAGNRFLDSHAAWREALRRQGQRSGKSISIGWPLWSGGGMEIAGDKASVFGFSGMTALPLEQGLAVFESTLRSQLSHVVVAAGDAEKVARALRVRAPAAPAAVQAAPTAPRPALAPDGAGGELLPRAVRYVNERLGKVVKADPTQIRGDQTFEQFGLDSVMLMELHASLSEDIAGLPKTVLFEHDSPVALAQYLLKQHAAELEAKLGPAPAANGTAHAGGNAIAAGGTAHAGGNTIATNGAVKNGAPLTLPVSTHAARASRPLPPSRWQAPARARAEAPADAVAIVGMAGEFPMADDLEAFWENVLTGRDCLVPIPEERWPAAAMSRNGREVRCGRGGFLRDALQFDPVLFRMTQAEAELMDPQMRVLLRVAWRALEDAAYTSESLTGRRVGVYAGAMNEDHTWIMSELQQARGEYVGPGSVISELANRISFLLNFRGPSVTVSTACSSSLTAVHLARKAILDGECDVAMAGAVNLSLHPSKYLMLDGMKVLSPDGRERTFDDRANGLVPSEGAGVVVLKRLSQAIEDGDQIHGVLRASSISHSGTGSGLFIPNLKVVEETAARAIRESGIRAEELTYIESHGASTGLGDPIELRALANAVEQLTPTKEFCAIGTKANLGHMEGASGVCSLIKVLLAMRHGRLAPCAGLESLSAAHGPAALPFHFPRQAQEWSANARGTRAAGINSFGMGGSNAFVVVESHVAEAPKPAVREPSLVVLSARSPQALRAYVKSLAAQLGRGGGAAVPFADLAYSSQVGRVAFEHRLAIVASDATELVERAERYLEGHTVGGVHAGHVRPSEPLPDLLAGTAGARFIEALVQERDWDKLAALWVRGCAVEWTRVHAEAKRRRVSLPGAPFENVLCDIRRSTGAAASLAARAAAEARRPVSTEEMAAALKAAAASAPADWFRPSAESADLGQPAAGAEGGEEAVSRYWSEQLRASADTVAQLAPALLPGHGEAANAPVQVAKVSLSGELVQGLQRCTQVLRVEVETLIAGAWAILANRYTKAPRAQFGILRAEAGGGPAPVRVHTVVRGPLSNWLPALQRELDRQRTHAGVSLDRIEGWAGGGTLFDSVVSFERPAGEPQGPREPRAAMELSVMVQREVVTLSLAYRAPAALGNAETVLEHLEVLLEGIAKHPERNPAALAMRTRSDGRDRLWKALENGGGERQ